MLAKPHSANVAIVKETGSSAGLMGPSCAYAMNSFSTMRVPSRLPMVPLSCHGTPITQAIGLKTQPSTVWMLAGNQPSKPWIHPNSPLASAMRRSEEHTSELQSRLHLVCRLLLEKKKHSPTHQH